MPQRAILREYTDQFKRAGFIASPEVTKRAFCPETPVQSKRFVVDRTPEKSERI